MPEKLHSGRSLHAGISRIRGGPSCLIEPLEPRLLLSGAGDGLTGLAEGADIQRMNLRPAAFIENQGQWADPDLFYLWNARGAAIALTSSGPVIQLRKAINPKDAALPGSTSRAGAEAIPDFSAGSSAFTRSQHPASSLSPAFTLATDPDADPAAASPAFTLAETSDLQFIPLELSDPSLIEPSTFADPFAPGAEPVAFQTHTVSMRFEGANTVRPRGLELSQGYHNFYVGDPSLHRFNVPGFTSVIYENLYDGIDLVMLAVAGGGDRLKYEFHLAPGADPGQIRIAWEGLENLTLNEAAGSVQMQTPVGTLTDSGLYVYQPSEAGDKPVAARFGLDEAGSVTFQITGEYDAGRELVIDPEIVWGTYLGGNIYEESRDIAVNDHGDAFVVGHTLSSGWVLGGYDTSYSSDYDTFVVKLNADGTHAWSTYAGSGGNDFGNDITVSILGEVYVTGETFSVGWVSGGYDTTFNGNSDAYILKLADAGTHIWSTYMGGSLADGGNGIATDSASNVYIAGYTRSSGLAIGSFNSNYGGAMDGFVTKFGVSGNRIWSTYLGGTSDDYGSGIVVDYEGYIIASGASGSSGWVANGYDTSRNGSSDGFAVKIHTDGAHIWSTFLGGSSYDTGDGIAVDSLNNIYVSGYTSSSGWVSGGYDTTLAGSDLYVSKLGKNGSRIWSTYVGGAGGEYFGGITVDKSGCTYVLGKTESSGWISGGFDTTYSGNEDCFVAKLDINGYPVWSSYFGGVINNSPGGIATDKYISVYFSGWTNAADLFQFTQGFDNSFNGDSDAFAVRVSFPAIGDVTIDGDINAFDIDLIHARLRNGGPFHSRYDLNADAQITRLDADYLIRVILDTEYGDADLNGSVSIGDLVVLAQHYNLLEFGASWAQGDYNGNGSVTLGDLTILAEHFGFQRGGAALTGGPDFTGVPLWGLQALGAGLMGDDEEPDEEDAMADILAEMAALEDPS